MPLHLLGKKSWNVYNGDNIARVQRDEAAARAREEADELRMQEEDAARRLAILRGEPPPPLEGRQALGRDSNRADRDSNGLHAPAHSGACKRKRYGEDDTDFEMRAAREQADASGRVSREPLPSTLVSLVDGKGHISLFGEEEARRAEEKGGTEREAAKKKGNAEEPFQIRLADAAGMGGSRTGPWYATPDREASAALVPSKDVFGNEDPRRKVREVARLDASDPLAMMKRGAAKVRELGRERRREAEEREKALRSLRNEQRRRAKERKRREEYDDERKDDRKARGSTRAERPRHKHGTDRYEKSRHDKDRHEGRHRARREEQDRR